MRRQDQPAVEPRAFKVPVGGDDRVVGPRRLDRQHVDPGPADLALLDRGDQRRHVDDAAARRVDQKGVLLHRSELGRADHVPGFLGQRAMEADHVALGEQVVERLDPPHAGGDLDAGDRIGIVGDHLHAEGLGAERRGDADPAEADDAEDPPAHAGAPAAYASRRSG